MLSTVAVWLVLARDTRDLIDVGRLPADNGARDPHLEHHAVAMTRRLSLLNRGRRFETCRAHQCS